MAEKKHCARHLEREKRSGLVQKHEGQGDTGGDRKTEPTSADSRMKWKCIATAQGTPAQAWLIEIFVSVHQLPHPHRSVLTTKEQ
jgi:hypothetical protein